MRPLTDQGWQTINRLAQSYGVSTDAVMALLQAVVNGHGSMAQFNHWELGGGGQWMRGGMTMVGDMFNHGLKAKVDGLCSELSQLLDFDPFVPVPPPMASQSQWQGGSAGAQSYQYSSPASLFVPGTSDNSGSWWPVGLGSPNSSGGQNQVRYAYFADARRLAVDVNGSVTLYDTLDHQIGGVSQQQGPGSSVTFTSQYGTVSVASLPLISADGTTPMPPPSYVNPAPSASYFSPPPSASYSNGGSGTSYSNAAPMQTPTAQESDIFSSIERLADLQKKGILSQEEFSTKKAELLSRL